MDFKSIKAELHNLRYSILSKKENDQKLFADFQQRLNNLYQSQVNNSNAMLTAIDGLMARLDAAVQQNATAPEPKCACEETTYPEPSQEPKKANPSLAANRKTSAKRK